MKRQEKSKSGGRQSRSERDKDLPKDFSFLFYFLVWHVRTVVVTGTYVVRDTVSDEMDFRSLQERSTEAKQECMIHAVRKFYTRCLHRSHR